MHTFLHPLIIHPANLIFRDSAIFPGASCIITNVINYLHLLEDRIRYRHRLRSSLCLDQPTMALKHFARLPAMHSGFSGDNVHHHMFYLPIINVSWPTERYQERL